MTTMEAPRTSRRDTSKVVSKRERLQATLAALKMERSSWDAHYQLLADFLMPWSGRMFVEDRNRGARRHGRIYDSTGSKAVNTISSGLMATASSPARPWFRLQASDPTLDKIPAVRAWLDEAESRMRTVMFGTNTYRVLHGMYDELVVFGTAGSIVLANEKRVLHHHPVTTGEFWIAVDYEQTVNTLYREFQMTVVQMVEQFGWERCSDRVQNMYDGGKQDHQWVTVAHAIEPNTNRTYGSRDNRDMPFRSCYFEPGMGSKDSSDRLLSESGFSRFRALVPRWATSGRDVYGNSPGMLALGDVKGLQHKHERKAILLNQKTDPSLQGPGNIPEDSIGRLPGEYTPVDAVGTQAAIRPLFEIDLDYSAITADILDDRMRIQGALYADLFRMLQDSVDQSKTATEVRGLQEEKLIQLGPVAERLQTDLLEPLCDMVFEMMVERDMFPPMPEELDNQPLQIKFVSILAQAQRSIDTIAIDRYTMYLGTLKNLGHQDAHLKIDPDKAAEYYGDVLGVPQDLRVAGRQLALLRGKRNAAMAEADKLAAQKTQSETLRNMAAAPTGADQNALTDVMGSLQGYNRPLAAAG